MKKKNSEVKGGRRPFILPLTERRQRQITMGQGAVSTHYCLHPLSTNRDVKVQHSMRDFDKELEKLAKRASAIRKQKVNALKQ